MILLETLKTDGIVIIETSGKFEQSDFEKLTKAINAYIIDNGFVNGIILHTKDFHGWESLGAFIQHMQFIKNHHKEVKKVALVADSKFMSITPKIANHFVAANVKHFDYADMSTAKKWIREYS